MKRILFPAFALMLIVFITPFSVNAQQCGVKINSAVNYSVLSKSGFKVSFTNTNTNKTLTAVEFKIYLLDAFDEVIGTQTEIWESGDVDDPVKPGKSEYIARVCKKDDVSRVKAVVIRVRYEDGAKCYE